MWKHFVAGIAFPSPSQLARLSERTVPWKQIAAEFTLLAGFILASSILTWR